MTTYSFDQLRDAVQECTSYDLVQRFSDDEDEYVLVDPYGDVDGEPFYDLMDDEGNMIALESFDTYSEAEMNINAYFNMYPYAYVDIIVSPN